MWRIPDEEWEPVAGSVLARLRSLPDQDRPRICDDVSHVLLLRRS